ncbi:MAG TPA: RdgB/HAM1 family non-canonical purine NTP pyrophosphatase [Pseudomonadales bacterium]|nr:RdgB/HAM1 family non-canonical purine NTP pyrophosphatase [Pseudomonadales bacterium]
MTGPAARPGAERSVVLASGNAGKLAELAPLLAAVGLHLRPQSEFAVDAAAETATTFVENALAKAHHLARATGLPTLADDSGLIVDALQGAPGVRSARFAGDDAEDADNNRLLLERMAGIADRRARFCCVLVLLRGPEDPLPLIAQGTWEGRILEAPRGSGGFGYDPLFLDPVSGRAAAELSREEKSGRSHRGAAVRALRAGLEAAFGAADQTAAATTGT